METRKKVADLWTVTRNRPVYLLIRDWWYKNMYIWTHRLRYRLSHAQK